MQKGIKGLLRTFFCCCILIIAALAYFHPVLQGKVIQQSDIVQYTGMAKEQNDFRKRTGEEPYWTNSAFGGMPTFQLGCLLPTLLCEKTRSSYPFSSTPGQTISFFILSGSIFCSAV